MSEGLRCSLSPEEQAERGKAMEERLLTDDVDVTMRDGELALQYPGDAGVEEDLVWFVRTEQECCPFFEFHIEWAPDQGPVTLKIQHEDIAREDWQTMGYLPL